jgi:hypothetical protein
LLASADSGGLGVPEVHVLAEGLVDAPTAHVYGLISDFQQHHPRFLPDSFTNLEIEQGGIGAGTIFTFTVTAGGRMRNYRMRVGEPEPGRVLTESDTLSSMVTTWSLAPAGERTVVRIETRWDGATGVAGFFERIFAPQALRRIYLQQLRRLDRYARGQARELTAVGSR